LSASDHAETVRVVCAVEGEDHVRHCAAMLHSLLVQHPQSGIGIDYLHGDDTSSRGRKRVAAMVARMGADISFHRVPDTWVRSLPVKGFTGKATWYRISLDELLPDADRILYLDLDLLVMDSLLPLWSSPLDDCVVGAVTNVPELHERPYTERPELEGDEYFNAGVLLLDLAAIRREGIGERLRGFSVQNAARLRWRDQDALNEVLHDRRLPLHPRWNCMNAVMRFDWAVEYFGEEAVSEARSNPAIRHFEGPSSNKPWHLLCDPESQLQYTEHRRQTPWPRVRRSGRTPLNLMRYARRRLV
jgi:lipopolysaccharide biosynthesis glycosyltransferase